MTNSRGADPDLIARLRVAVQAGPRVRLAILFGSVAAGAARQDSDLDVAVLPDGSIFDTETEQTLNYQLALAARRDVDLVDIDRASTLLKWRVATTGVPILEVIPGEFARFRASAASEYIDFAPALAHHGEIFKRRLIEQGRVR